MLVYSRVVAKAALEEFPHALELTEDHVRAHLSSIADADDDPETNADDVVIVVHELENEFYVHGTLDADANAPYLNGEAEE